MSDHEIKLDYLKQRPQTNLEKLRVNLDQLERLVGSLRYLEAEEAKRIPVLFDQIADGFRSVEQSGSNLRGERTQLETAQIDFERQVASYIRILGGRQAVRELRRERQPDLQQWWWYPDRRLAERWMVRSKKWIVWMGLAAVVLIGLVVFYQRYLVPDEATQTSLTHKFDAENLASQGEYRAALEEIDLAIAARPDQIDLYLFKGVLAEILGENDTAADAFRVAEIGTPSRVIFLISRASEYLRYKQPGLAIEDAQAVQDLDPNQASAYLILGQAYETSGDFQKAIDNYRLADQVATEQNDAQVQVIARMSIGQLYNRLPVIAPTDEVTPTP